MWLLAGLGNPGEKYAGTRHNIGFDVIDRLASRARAAPFSSKFKGEITSARVGGEPAQLLKPLTFMNVSGDSVQPAMAFYKVPLERLIVVHDEIDLELGQLKLKVGGGHGGHNGIRHIAGRVGPNFSRVRVGVGRPKGRQNVSSHVLGGFGPDEQQEVELLIEQAADCVELLIREGLKAAQNRFHTAPSKKASKPPKPEPTPEQQFWRNLRRAVAKAKAAGAFAPTEEDEG